MWQCWCPACPGFVSFMVVAFVIFSVITKGALEIPCCRKLHGWAVASRDTVTVSTKCFWRDRMHPAPITASELKLHQLNFGWSRNKTIRSNNTRVQPAPESLCQLLQCHESPRHSIVQSHRSCPGHPGPSGPLSQPVPRGPHRGWRNPAQLRQLLLSVHFGKELGGFPNASTWQPIPAIPVMH